MTLDNVSSLVVRLIIDIAYGRDRLFIRTVDFTYSCFHRQFEESFSVLKEFFDSTVSLGLHGDHFYLVKTPANSAVSILSSTSPTPLRDSLEELPIEPASPEPSPLPTSSTCKPQAASKRNLGLEHSSGPPVKSPRHRSSSNTSLAPADDAQVGLVDEDVEDVEDGLGRKKLKKKCPLCFESVDERIFKRHMEKHELKAPSFACNLCGKKFCRLDNLVRHQRESCPRL